MSTDVVNQIKIVDFHGHKLQTFEDNGERYVVMRPVVLAMGLTWQSQNRKFLGQEDYWGIRHHMMTDAAGAHRKMMTIPLRRYPMWLASIGAARIPDPEVRARVVLFQEMSTEALYQFWMTGSATMESVTREIDPDRVKEELEKIAERVTHDSERTRAVVIAKSEYTRNSVWCAVNSLPDKIGKAVGNAIAEGCRQVCEWFDPRLKLIADENAQTFAATVDLGKKVDALSEKIDSLSQKLEHGDPLVLRSMLTLVNSQQRMADILDRKL